MRFARWVFCIAGVYGLLVLTPFYFMEKQIGIDQPPPITHPEYFYGFIGVALSWQVAFLVIGADPARYRALMIPAVLEKLSYGVPCIALYAQGKLPTVVLAFGCADLVLGTLFATSFWLTRKSPPLP